MTVPLHTIGNLAASQTQGPKLLSIDRNSSPVVPNVIRTPTGPQVRVRRNLIGVRNRDDVRREERVLDVENAGVTTALSITTAAKLEDGITRVTAAMAQGLNDHANEYEPASIGEKVASEMGNQAVARQMIRARRYMGVFDASVMNLIPPR